jgi:hypothetical protein
MTCNWDEPIRSPFAIIKLPFNLDIFVELKLNEASSIFVETKVDLATTTRTPNNSSDLWAQIRMSVSIRTRWILSRYYFLWGGFFITMNAL